MTNIEELAHAVIQQPHLKDAIRQHLSSCLLELKQNEDNNEVRMDHLVGEIEEQMARITQFALEEENTVRYMDLVRKSEELSREIEKKMEMELNARTAQLKSQIEEIRGQIGKNLKDIKNISKPISNPKQQRQNLTKNILERSSYFKQGKARSTIDPFVLRQNTEMSLLLDESKNQSQMGLGNQSRNRSSCLCSCQSDKENATILGLEISSEVNRLKKENQSIEKKFQGLSESLEAKIQINLQGLWNVLGDLNTRIAKLQGIPMIIELIEKHQE